jgi:hypothetical protein
MRPSRLCAVLLGAGVTLALGTGFSTANAAVTHPSAAATAGAAGSTLASAATTWGKAEEVPGTATLNKGENAVTNSVSCPSAGNCTAGGSYTDGSFHTQAFVVNES